MNSIIETAVADQAVNISNAAPALLRTLFLHHDGIIVGATVGALQRHGLLERLFGEKSMSMDALLEEFSCNSGYLHVALRCLALQGWIKREGPLASGKMVFTVTPQGDAASASFESYTQVADFVYSGQSVDSLLLRDHVSDGAECGYAVLVARSIKNWGLSGYTEEGKDGGVAKIIGKHLDGMLVGPTMIAAKNQGLLEGSSFPEERLRTSNENRRAVLELLRHLDWVHLIGNQWVFTELGRLACQFSLHYGLTLSYFPMLRRLSKLIFNSSDNITHVQPGDEEVHVDRTLNVLASGVAHRRYFEDSDKIIVEIFNRSPLREQPSFVADMGCGDGTWLKRIYQVVKNKTLRGQNLDKFPLLMVAADYNIKAQEVAHNLLKEAGIRHLALFGDITDPDQFADALAGHDIDIADGLHIRAFIDHNRRYLIPLNHECVTSRPALSSGAYADENGNTVPNNLLEEDFVEHLRKWSLYVRKHGLIVIEAHNVEPQIASRYNGQTHATAFDTYHGYSNQYPLDYEVFMQLAEEAGLRAISYHQSLYPSRLPFVAISINCFKAADPNPFAKFRAEANRGASEWQPDGSEDLQDGEALHRFLYEEGDITRPRRWCVRATGLLVDSVLVEIERRLLRIVKDEKSRRTLTMVDYGAGTGLATLELIKGLSEKGLLKRFEENEIAFNLLLLDFPSGWFAKGYELLKQFPFVQFHSLKDAETGRIRLISDIVGDQKVDIIIASMVFHLVPPKALPSVRESFTAVLKDDGILIWNSPDTKPAPANAEVIHATNRALRKCFLANLEDGERFRALLSNLPDDKYRQYSYLARELDEIKQQMTPDLREKAQARADKQILPEPTRLDTIKSALESHFSGTDSTLVSLMTDQDLVDLALLPANQRYINEVDDVKSREQLIDILLRLEVIPNFRAGPAGHPKGINLHWTLGRYTKNPKGG